MTAPRGITPRRKQYILKSRAHARKSRTKLRTTDRDYGKAQKLVEQRGQRAPCRLERLTGVCRDLPLQT